MKGFTNTDIYVDGVGIIKTSLAIDNGKIYSIGDNLQLDEIIDLPNDAVVLPGFIDQHIHGAGSADVMDGSFDALQTIANSVACEGTTAFLATTMTQSKENICKALYSVNDYIKSNSVSGAQLLGVHLEGPYINKSKAGAQLCEYITEPDISEFDFYNKASGNKIKIVTVAPDINGCLNLVSHLKQIGIRANVGHSAATFEQVKRSTVCGVSGVTHTFNAQSPFTHREAGIVGFALYDLDLKCELICDLIHVGLPAIKLLLKNKNRDAIILITDAMRAKNLGDTVSELGGQTVYVKNGAARLFDGTLAGSVLKMNDAVKNVVKSCNIPLEVASDFASKNPAQYLGLYDTTGSIAIGKKANFAVLSQNDFSVYLTMRDGMIIYKK